MAVSRLRQRHLDRGPASERTYHERTLTRTTSDQRQRQPEASRRRREAARRPRIVSHQEFVIVAAPQLLELRDVPPRFEQVPRRKIYRERLLVDQRADV